MKGVKLCLSSIRIALSFALLAPFARAEQACYTTSKEWDAWWIRTSKHMASVTEKSISPNQYAQIKEDFEYLSKCKKDPKTGLVEGSGRCTENLDRFLEGVYSHLRGNHSEIGQTTMEGVSSTSSTYPDGRVVKTESDSYSRVVVKKLRYPEWVEGQEFKKVIHEPGFDGLVKFLDSKNVLLPSDQKLRYIRFRGFSFGADAAHPGERFMIYIPGNPERMILIRKTLSYDPKRDGTDFSKIPVSRPCVGGPCDGDIALFGMFQEPGRVVNYIREGFIVHPVSQEKTQPLQDQPFSPGDCFKCHSSGPIAIHGPVDPRDSGTAAFVNKRIRLATGDWDGYNRFAEMGPGYGSTMPEAEAGRTDEFLNKCSQGVVGSPDKAAKFRSVMNCAECHNNGGRAALTPFNSEMMERYILSGLMPPAEHLKGIYLSKPERKALLRCLRVEYPAVLNTWLMKRNCSDFYRFEKLREKKPEDCK